METRQAPNALHRTRPVLEMRDDSLDARSMSTEQPRSLTLASPHPRL